MSELKRTELRHRMLAEVAAGNVAAIEGLGWHWGDREAAMGQEEKRVLTEFETGQHVRIIKNWRDTSIWQQVNATEAGAALLASWNDQYGEVQP